MCEGTQYHIFKSYYFFCHQRNDRRSKQFLHESVNPQQQRIIKKSETVSAILGVGKNIAMLCKNKRLKSALFSKNLNEQCPIIRCINNIKWTSNSMQQTSHIHISKSTPLFACPNVFIKYLNT